MVKNFLSGVVLGGLVAGVGLGVASQLVPLDRDTATSAADVALATPTPTPKPKPKPGPNAPDAAVKDATLGAETAPVAEATSAESAQTAPTEAEQADSLLAPVPEPTLPEPTLPEPNLPEPALPDASAPETAKPAPDTQSVAAKPAPANAAAVDEVAPKVDPDAAIASAPAATAPTATAPQDPNAGENAALPDPQADGTAMESDANAATKVDAPLEPAADPAAAEKTATLPATSPLKPAESLADQQVAGVTTGRLPRIDASTDPENAQDKAPSPDAALAQPADASQPPVVRFAKPFQNEGAKPLFAVLLIDPGTADVNRAELAALPFPVTFVIDAMSDTAVEAAKAYRGAGQEVVMLANGIPKGAKASDLEQSFVKLTETLPEAVALIDTADAIFQDSRGLAAEVVTLLAAQGRGVVTFDRGLNAADQVARREGVPSATIFRSLDDDGEDAPLIRRYLDRAAFKAAQEGQVVVIGTARPETIAALLEWAVEGRAASVALAPITAVMATK